MNEKSDSAGEIISYLRTDRVQIDERRARLLSRYPFLEREDDPYWINFFAWVNDRYPHVRPPETQDEREAYADLWGKVGRLELWVVCKPSAYALVNWEDQMDVETKFFLGRHIGDETHHARTYIEIAQRLSSHKDQWHYTDHETEVLNSVYQRTIKDWWTYLGYLALSQEMSGITGFFFIGMEDPQMMDYKMNKQWPDEYQHSLFFRRKLRDFIDRADPGERQEIRHKLVRASEEQATATVLSSLYDPEMFVKAGYQRPTKELEALQAEHRRFNYQRYLDIDDAAPLMAGVR